MKSIIKSAFVATAIFGLPTMANAACDTGFVEVSLPAPDVSGFDGTFAFPGGGTPAAGNICVSATSLTLPNIAKGFVATGDFSNVGGVSVYQAARADVIGLNSTAIGNGAKVGEIRPGADGILGTADDIIAPVNDGTAIGARANVQHEHSTALGADSASTTDHQVVLGTKDDTVTAPGITSQLSKDRQVGPTEIVTTDANGNLASDGGATWHAIGHLDGKVNKAFDGIAIATAMESPQVDPGKRFGVSLSWGNFEGSNAFAAAAKLRFTDNIAGTAGIGYGLSEHTVATRAGVQFQW